MSEIDTKKLNNSETTKKLFWNTTFPKLFPNSNNYKTVLSMPYSGSTVDKFIDKIFNDVKEKQDKEICLNCIFSSLKDIDFHEGKMHHSCSTGVTEYIFNNEPFVSEDFGCRKFKAKKKED